MVGECLEERSLPVDGKHRTGSRAAGLLEDLGIEEPVNRTLLPHERS